MNFIGYGLHRDQPTAWELEFFCSYLNLDFKLPVIIHLWNMRMTKVCFGWIWMVLEIEMRWSFLFTTLITGLYFRSVHFLSNLNVLIKWINLGWSPMAWTSAHRNCFPKAETRRWRSSSIRRYEPQIFRTLELNYISFSDMYLEWGGGDFSTLGYIFHGQDEFYNLEHEPVS